MERQMLELYKKATRSTGKQGTCVRIQIQFLLVWQKTEALSFSKTVIFRATFEHD